MTNPYSSSASAVSLVLTSVLPPGVPPSFNKILSSHWVGTGRKRIATATLEMFDGLTASVECWNYGRKEWIDGWAHRWTSMDGGDISWNGSNWERVKREE